MELLVSVAIIGLLIALLLPAVMHARESARRLVCTSHLREVGLAIQNHHGSRQRLPQAWRLAEQDPEFGYGWATQILPELEEQDLARGFDFHRRPGSAAPQSVALASLPVLLCPSDLNEPTFDLAEEAEEDDAASSPSAAAASDAAARVAPQNLIALPTASYVGVFGTYEADEFGELDDDGSQVIADGSVIHDRRVRFRDLRRGLGKTLLVGERMMSTVPSTWLGVDLRGEDAACRLVGSAMTRPNCGECDECEFTSRHAGGANFLWADGHVAMIDDSVDSELYREYARRAAN